MKTLSAIALILLFSACSSLRPVVDQTRYFVLSSGSPEQSLLQQTGIIGIGQIELPHYLRKREMAWRSGDEEIRYASNFQWAEPLDKMIGRLLASELHSVLAPNYRRDEVQAEISIVLSRFDSDETGQVTVEASWTIRYNSGNSTRGAAKLSSLGPVLSKDPAGAAAELSAGLRKLGAEILKAIQIAP